MSDIADGIGGAIEGGMAARAIEPDNGGDAQAPAGSAHREGICLNCGTTLTGVHCQDCGQKGDIHRSLKTIFHDLIHGVLHLDGKLWRTLPLLAWRPGDLTRRYIAGERAKFVSPMAMFLFSVFLMFAVFQVLGITTPTTLEDNDTIQIDTAADDAPESAAKDGANNIEFSGTGIESIDQGIVEKWQANPGLMLYKLQNNAYKFSWLLIPLSIPLVWSMFFWKRRFKAYDHAIFVTYSLSFMSLLFILLSVLGTLNAPAQAIAIAAVLIPSLHIYRQLRGAYELPRRSALWRTIALCFGILGGVVTGFLWILVLLGAL